MPPQMILRLINLLVAGLLAGGGLGIWLVARPALYGGSLTPAGDAQRFRRRFLVVMLIGVVLALVVTGAALANIRNAGNARYNLTLAALVCESFALVIMLIEARLIKTARRRELVHCLSIVLSTLAFTCLSLAALSSVGLR